jgi:tRNA(fMet)-specific endonuclease VapC
MSYLSDSDVLIDALNGRESALDILERHSNDFIAVSTISLGEIFDGAIGSRDPERHLAMARGFLEPFFLVPPDASIMSQFAQLRVDLRRSGLLIPDFDLVIAATAIVHDLTLITRNRRHYERAEGLRLYRE